MADDFPGMTPGMRVKEGENVKRGQVLFEDRKNPGVLHTAAGAGRVIGVTTAIYSPSGANAGVGYIILKEWSARGAGEDLRSLVFGLNKKLEAVTEARILVIPPPPIQGIGNAAGFAMQVELRDGDRTIRVARGGVVQAAPALAPATDAAPAAADEEPEAGAVTSPMVGTIYLSPGPGEPAFIAVGGQVAEGDTLFIVEAMKVMNPILAPRAGTVKRILARDAQPVEFGEVLVVLE